MLLNSFLGRLCVLKKVWTWIIRWRLCVLLFDFSFWLMQKLILSAFCCANHWPRQVPYLKAHVVPFFLLTWTNCKSSRLIFLNSEVRSKAFQAVEQFLEILKQNYEKVEITAYSLPLFLEVLLVCKVLIDIWFVNRQTLERQEASEEPQLYLKLLVWSGECSRWWTIYMWTLLRVFGILNTFTLIDGLWDSEG